jgi:hypothetical protein
MCGCVISYTVEPEISYPVSCISAVLVKQLFMKGCVKSKIHGTCVVCLMWWEDYVIGRMFVTRFIDVESGGNSEL